MSYSIIPIPKFDYRHILNPSEVMYVPMGALSAADATTLQVSIKVGAFAGVTASLALQESYDGVVWTAVTSSGATALTSATTFAIKVAGTHGPLLPIVRLVITADGATTIGITSIQRTFVQSSVMIPRDVSIIGGATEATALDILAAVDGLETLVGTTNTNLTVVKAKLDTLHTDNTTTHGYIDGIEALIGTTNTNTADTKTAVDAVKTAVDLTTTAVNTVNTTTGTVKTAVDSTNTKLDTVLTRLAGAFVNVAYDYMTYTSGASDDVYVFKTGGSGGATVKTLTIVYTGVDKQTISTVAAT